MIGLNKIMDSDDKNAKTVLFKTYCKITSEILWTVTYTLAFRLAI